MKDPLERLAQALKHDAPVIDKQRMEETVGAALAAADQEKGLPHRQSSRKGARTVPRTGWRRSMVSRRVGAGAAAAVAVVGGVLVMTNDDLRRMGGLDHSGAPAVEVGSITGGDSFREATPKSRENASEQTTATTRAAEAFAPAEDAPSAPAARAESFGLMEADIARNQGAAREVAPRSAVIGLAPVIADLDGVERTTAAERAGNTFEASKPNGWMRVMSAPVSTFGLEADTASWPWMRSQIESGRLPDANGVRLEEMLAYFDFDYAAPESAEEPFNPSIAVIETPWDSETRLIRIGIRGYEVEDRGAQNLTLLIDVSGSMKHPEKLGLIVAGAKMLVDQMSERDTLAIVTYAGTAAVALEPTSGREKSRIKAALDSLQGGGGTAGAQGLLTAYDLAEREFDPSKANRVVIGTDGDFNVGISDLDALEDLIADKRETGIYLSVIGVGESGYNDAIAQRLAQTGNGTAYFIDSLSEARRVLVERLTGTLTTIAKDVKAQVEWNPARVADYRLLGFETRALAREDFNDDSVDSGEIGSGHSVTAIYEVTLVGSGAERVDPLRYQDERPSERSSASDELGFLKIRYKLPDDADSRLIERPISEVGDGLSREDEASFAAAVAAAGMILRGQNIGIDLERVAELAERHLGEDRDGERRAFVRTIRAAAALER